MAIAAVTSRTKGQCVGSSVWRELKAVCAMSERGAGIVWEEDKDSTSL
jgi:hypothetical protein